MDKEFDLYALLKEIKSFAERSNNRFKEQKQRIKEDKEFLWVKPYPDTINKILGTERYRGHLDVVSNAIRSVVNSYTSYPYKPRVNDNLLSQCFNKLTDNINEAVEDAFRYDKMVLMASSYNMGVFPPMEQFLNHLISKNYQNRKVGIVENGTWAPSSGRCMKDALEKMKNIEIYEPLVTIKSKLNDNSRKELENLANNII